MPSLGPAQAPYFGTLRLDARSNAPLEPEFFVSMSDSQAIALDVPSQELWRFTFVDAGIHMSRIGSAQGRGQQRALLMGPGPEGLGVMDARGVIRLLDAAGGQVGELRMRVPAGARAVALHGLSNGDWMVLAEHIQPSTDGQTLVDSLLLLRVPRAGDATTIWAREKPMRALLSDYVSMTARGDTAFIAASAPARVYRVPSDDPGAADSVILAGAPRRPIPAGERAKTGDAMRRLRANVGKIDQPTRYPAVAEAWRVPNGWLVRSGTGTDLFALEGFCGSQHRATVLQGPDIVGISVLPSVVIVRRRHLETFSFSLDFYRTSQLRVACP